MPARFFVDENDLALGKLLAAAHGDVVYPGHPDLPAVPRGSIDDDWLPVVGASRPVVITRDQRIRYRLVEKQMWLDHAVRGFVLTGRKSQSTAESLAVLANHWPDIEALVDARPDGPWMYSVTQERLRGIELS
ncbi:MAG: hypothetical protein ACRDYW_10390 [Acidimicrobiales bacterium]